MKEKRPLGIPCVADRGLQRSVASVLAAIYEHDFLPCSFCGRAWTQRSSRAGNADGGHSGKPGSGPDVKPKSQTVCPSALVIGARGLVPEHESSVD